LSYSSSGYCCLSFFACFTSRTTVALAYFGSYEVQGDVIVHRIDASLFPNWTGTVHERLNALLDADRKGHVLATSHLTGYYSTTPA
jgi:Lipocalin-like domain